MRVGTRIRARVGRWRRPGPERQRHPSAPRRPVASPDPGARRRWRERLWFARVVRVVVALAPLVASFAFAWWWSAVLPVPASFGLRVVRWLGIAVASTIVLLGVQRALRRLLPLAALLSLTLVFPDEAPSRFRVALRSYSARDLDRSLREMADATADHDTQRAAEQLLVLVAALSRHDRLTRGHSERVRAYTLMIAEEMALEPDAIDRLRWAGLLHDVGKLHVPPEILNKPGRLTDEEFAVIREHTTHGARLTAGLAGWLGDDVRAVDEHHERWAGGGYPHGYRGDQISNAARIVAVADAFDVMTSARSYKRPMPASAARAELERCAGSQFDPTVVRAMLGISLGRLWRAMGPLSWMAQLRLFPRQVAQGGTTLVTTAATAVAMALTVIAGTIAGGRVEPADLAAAVVPTRVVVPTTVPPATTVVPTSTTGTTVPTSTTSTIATTTTATTSTVPRTTRPPAVVVTTRPTTTTIPTTTTTATTTTAAATTSSVPPATTAATTSSTSSTTSTSTTTTTSTTVVAAVPVVLALTSPAPGDTASQPFIELVAGHVPQNPGLPNYDVDRNADPGLTIERSLEVLEASDPAERQVWLLPADVAAFPATASLSLSVAPAGTIAPGDELHVRAGVFQCDAQRACSRLVRSEVAVPATTAGMFVPVTFDLSIGTPTAIAAGRRLELRVSVVYSSDTDTWLAYDSADHPSALVLGP
jgi:hypothetical protein